MPKRTGYSASTWRKLDKKHRDEERARRQANAARRAEVAAAASAGVPVEVWRKQQEESNDE